MKIKNLKVDNFMKLTAVDLKLEGKDLIISGKNEVGKSSLINSIFIAVTGKGIPDEPIQQGKDSAEIEVIVDRPDNTTLVCTRKFKRNGKDTLKVTTEDGADYKSPQAFMNKIFGEISFDPFEFMDLQPREQKKYLQDILKINTDDIDARKSGLLSQKKSFDDQITSFDQRLSKYPEKVEGLQPRELSEIKELQDSITKYNDSLASDKESAAELQRVRKTTEGAILGKKEKISSGESRIIILQKEIDEINSNNINHRNEMVLFEEDLVKINTSIIEIDKIISEHESKKPDTSKLETIVQEITDHNKKVDLQTERAELEAERLYVLNLLEEKKQQIKDVEDERIQLIQSVKMPIDGLDFTSDGVTFEGLPFTKDQFSTGRMDEIGFRITVALNPNLRILKIKDWPLLDTDRKNTVIKLARENDFQMFIETVTDDKEIGFEITEVVSADSKPFISREDGAKARASKKTEK